MRRAAVLLGACLIAVGCAKRSSSSGVQAPNFTLKNIAGDSVSLTDFRGHPVLLDFWATWCYPCRVSIPAVDALYKRHKADGLVVLGMNMDDDPSPVFSFVKKVGMTYPVLYAGNSPLGSDYQMEGIPMFILIAPDGHVIDRFDGYAPDMPEMWEKELQPFLAKKS